MIKHCMLIVAIAGLLYAVPASIAQDNGANSDQQSEHMGGPGRGHMGPAQRTKMLTKHLNLNSDQQAKVLDILKSSQSQMESLRSDSSASQEDRHSKMMEIHKGTDDQIRAVLDPNQQKKWDEMQSKRGQRMEHRQGQAPPDSDQQPK
jgi:Spy/CpxP family protein refolding chaperone